MDAAGGWSALVSDREQEPRALIKHTRSSQQRRLQELRYFEETLPVKSSVRDYIPFVFAGLMLVTAFAFAGHYIGRNALANNAPIVEIQPLVVPITSLATKGSLLPEGTSFPIINQNTIRSQVVLIDGKGDLDIVEVVAPVPPPLPKPKPVKIANTVKPVKIVPVSIDLTKADEPPTAAKRIVALAKVDEPPTAVKRMVVSPAIAHVEKTFKINSGEKQKVVVQRRIRLAEENCLARAVYFEARSESEMGQLAVAKVILNRVKSPNFPKSICGVVYQGSGVRNSCQFSFACDGLADDVKQPASWSRAKAIAQRAINNDPAVAMMGSATNYHADYVKPKWAKTMRRLTKIGRHIFYAG
jgi:spore germination cell wall hydrolase CwlJ-like protein